MKAAQRWIKILRLDKGERASIVVLGCAIAAWGWYLAL